MNGHAMEFLARERLQEQLQEAERDRLARSAASTSNGDRLGRFQLALPAIGRLTRLAAVGWSRGRPEARITETKQGG